MFDEDGRVLLRVEGFRCQAVPRAGAAMSGDPIAEWFYRYEWRETESHTFQGLKPDQTGEWIVVSDDTRFGDDVAACLVAQGIQCLQVRHGIAFPRPHVAEGNFPFPHVGKGSFPRPHVVKGGWGDLKE